MFLRLHRAAFAPGSRRSPGKIRISHRICSERFRNDLVGASIPAGFGTASNRTCGQPIVSTRIFHRVRQQLRSEIDEGAHRPERDKFKKKSPVHPDWAMSRPGETQHITGHKPTQFQRKRKR